MFIKLTRLQFSITYFIVSTCELFSRVQLVKIKKKFSIKLLIFTA